VVRPKDVPDDQVLASEFEAYAKGAKEQSATEASDQGVP
jgi:hypothetical protein